MLYKMPKKIIFHVRKHTYKRVERCRMDKLSASIFFQRFKVGHIIGGTVYLYIRSKDPVLRFTPEPYYKYFKDFFEAVTWVKDNGAQIWQETPNLYHPLKSKLYEQSGIQGSVQGTQGVLPL